MADEVPEDNNYILQPEGGVDPEELRAKLLALGAEDKPDYEAKPELAPVKAGDSEIRDFNAEDNEDEGERTEEDKETAQEEAVEEEVVTRIDIDAIPDEESQDDIELGEYGAPILYGNVEIFLEDFQILKARKTDPELRGPKDKGAVEYDPSGHIRLDVESVWWKRKVICDRCPTNFNCTCNQSLKDVVNNLSECFDLVVISDNNCTTCLQVLDIVRKKKIMFCQLNLEEIGQSKRAELQAYLKSGDADLLRQCVFHHWAHKDLLPPKVFHHWMRDEPDKKVSLLAEEVPLGKPDWFDIIVIGTSLAALGIAKEAEERGLRVCLVEAESEGTWGHGRPDWAYLDALKRLFLKAAHLQWDLRQARASGLTDTEAVFFDWDMFRSSARRRLEAMAWQYGAEMRRRGVLHAAGLPTLLNRNTLLVKTRLGDALELRGKYVVHAANGRLEYEHFPGLHRYCCKVDRLLRYDIFGISKILVYGSTPTVFEFAEIFQRFKYDVTLMMDQNLPPSFDADFIHLLQESMTDSGIKMLLNMRIERVVPVPRGANGLPSIPEVNERLVVVGRCMESGKRSRHFFDHVIVLPHDVPRTGVEGLADVGIRLSEHDPNLIKVDDNFKTSVSNIFALGSVVQGMQNSSKSLERLGRRLVQYISGEVTSVPRCDLKMGVLPTIPEYSFYGPTEQEARAAYDDLVVYQRSGARWTLQTDNKTYSKLICRRRATGNTRFREDIVGLHVLGADWAANTVRGLAPAISEGLTKRELDRLNGVPYSSAEGLIGMEAVRKEGDAVLEVGECCRSQYHDTPPAVVAEGSPTGGEAEGRSPTAEAVETSPTGGQEAEELSPSRESGGSG